MDGIREALARRYPQLEGEALDRAAAWLAFRVLERDWGLSPRKRQYSAYTVQDTLRDLNEWTKPILQSLRKAAHQRDPKAARAEARNRGYYGYNWIETQVPTWTGIQTPNTQPIDPDDPLVSSSAGMLMMTWKEHTPAEFSTLTAELGMYTRELYRVVLEIVDPYSRQPAGKLADQLEAAKYGVAQTLQRGMQIAGYPGYFPFSERTWIGPVAVTLWWWDIQQPRRMQEAIETLQRAIATLQRLGLGFALEGLRVSVSRVLALQGERHLPPAGVYDSTRDTLDYLAVQRPGQGERVFYHELAHRFYYRNLSPRLRSEWKREWENDAALQARAKAEAVSPYAKTNEQEWFAEAFAAYIERGPRALPEWSRAFLERRIEEGGGRRRNPKEIIGEI